MSIAGGRPASIAIGAAIAVIVIAVAIVPFLSPQWVAFEQDRAQAAAWTGFSPRDLGTASNSILQDLIIGGEFAVEVGGQPVLNERERAHMADVRTMFRGLWVLTAIAVVVLVIASQRSGRARLWRAIRMGALGLTGGVIVLGVVALVAFDSLFDVFHEVFFPAGSYLFDPTTDRLVQLFPFQFWEETALAVGVVIIVIALGVARFAGRGQTAEPAVRAATNTAFTEEPRP